MPTTKHVRVKHMKPWLTGSGICTGISVICGHCDGNGWVYSYLERVQGTAFLTWYEGKLVPHIWTGRGWAISNANHARLLSDIAYVLLSRMNSAPCWYTKDEFYAALTEKK